MASEQEVLATLAKLINEQSSGSVFQPRATDERGEARDDKQRAKDAAKMMSDQLSVGMKKSLKELPKELQKALDKSGNRLVKELAGTTKTLQDVLRADDQIAAMKQITSRLSEIGDKKFESQEELDKELKRLGDIAEASGMSLDKLKIKAKSTQNELGKFEYQIEDTADVIDELKKATEEYTAVTDSARASTQKFTGKTEKASKALDTFWRILKKSAEIAEKEIRFAMERATADQGVIKGIMDLQISQSEYAKILADTRQEQFAMRSAGVDFNKLLKEGAEDLRGFTSSNVEAAQVTNLIVKNISRMGVAQNELEGEVKAQIAQYKEQARAYGMSAREMAKLTENLLADDEYRMQITRLRGKERAEFVRGIAQRQKEYKAMGYTAERALGVQKALAAIEGMNPKERYKQAAKKRAMLGALGMGAEGARLMELETKVQYAKGKDKVAMQEEIAKINAEASNKFLAKTGAGASIGTAMAYGQMADKTGFSQIIKTFETTSGEGLKHQEQIAKNTEEVPGILSKIINSVDAIGAVVQSSAGSLATGILSTIASGIFEVVKYAIIATALQGGGSVFGKIAGVGRGIGSAAMGAVKGVGGMAASAGRMAAGAAMGPAGMLLGAGAVGYGAGTLINNQLSDDTKEGIGDFVGKSVDSVLSFFGDKEAQKRLEIMSAPIREIGETKKDTLTPEQRMEKEAKVKSRQEMVERKKEDIAKLNKTLDELIIYLKEANGANTELAQSVNKTAEAAEKTLRVNAIPDRRQ